MLGTFAVVDLVVPFAEDTPWNSPKQLRPDVLIKGADYTIDQIVGADLVEGYGGTVVRAELTKGQSTTRIITRFDKQVS